MSDSSANKIRGRSATLFVHCSSLVEGEGLISMEQWGFLSVTAGYQVSHCMAYVCYATTAMLIRDGDGMGRGWEIRF